ncbi:MAG: FxsA family protein [Proteobacteria bacterium]|nr:FxsA family protein [Pseudomonadota bacterium]
MRFVVFAMVVGFPLVDVYVSLRFARWSGVPLWAWLAVSTVAGFLLLRSERASFRMNTAAALRGDQPLFRGLVDSGRKVLAGFLLIMPGLLSDLLAVMLLLLPINVGRARLVTRATSGGR